MTAIRNMSYKLYFVCCQICLFGFNTFAQSDKEFMEDLKIENFALESNIHNYPDFVRVDSVPKNTLLEASLQMPGRRYYMHKNSGRYKLVDEPVLYLIATTNLRNEIFAVNAVCYYSEGMLSKLNLVYGHWQVASWGGREGNPDLDESNYPFYIWKYNHDSLDLSINRNMTVRNQVKRLDDYMIFSYRVKDYEERLKRK